MIAEKWQHQVYELTTVWLALNTHTVESSAQEKREVLINSEHNLDDLWKYSEWKELKEINLKDPTHCSVIAQHRQDHLEQNLRWILGMLALVQAALLPQPQDELWLHVYITTPHLFDFLFSVFMCSIVVCVFFFKMWAGMHVNSCMCMPEVGVKIQPLVWEVLLSYV